MDPLPLSLVIHALAALALALALVEDADGVLLVALLGLAVLGREFCPAR